MTLSEIYKAHKHSSNHRAEILSSATCGCFACLKQFSPAKIAAWTDEGECALCPECGVDAVIGSASGFKIDDAFLTTMQDYWF